MPFLDGCACHVWAIDGYTDDATAADVNNRYVDAGTFLASANNGALGQLNMIVGGLVGVCRVTDPTDIPCTIHGAFTNAQDATPTHMWLEYQGWLFDTMPGRQLWAVPAHGRAGWPACETTAVPLALVGSATSVLTQSQHDLIARFDASTQLVVYGPMRIWNVDSHRGLPEPMDIS